MTRNFSFHFSKVLIFWVFTAILFLPMSARPADRSLLLLPLKLYADESKSYLREGIRSIFISRLSGEGLRIIREESLAPLLTEAERKGITGKERAEALAKTLKADYALFGSITGVGSGYSLDLFLLELREGGSKQKAISETVNEDQFIPRMADVAHRLRAVIEGGEMPARIAGPRTPAPPPAEETSKGLFSKLNREGEAPVVTERGLFYQTSPIAGFEPTGRISVGAEVMAMDMGDLDGAGEAELVVLTRDKLLLYQRQGTSFALKDTLKAGLGEFFLKVSVGDADHDGRAEIYLVSQDGSRARSTLYEWTGAFKKRDRRVGHMQLIKDAQGGVAQVLFQDSKNSNFFSGDIYAVTPNGEGKFSQKELVRAPKGVQFYTLARHDLDKDGGPEWLGLEKPGLSEQAKLLVWDGEGKIMWSGGASLGGTNNAIRVGTAPPGDLPPRIAFNPRVIITDIDGDGNKEVLAVTNIPLIEKTRDFKVYTKAKLTAFSIQGPTLVPAWSTREISYCVTDIQAEGGTLFLAAQKGKIANVIVKERGYVMWFE